MGKVGWSSCVVTRLSQPIDAYVFQSSLCPHRSHFLLKLDSDLLHSLRLVILHPHRELELLGGELNSRCSVIEFAIFDFLGKEGSIGDYDNKGDQELGW